MALASGFSQGSFLVSLIFELPKVIKKTNTFGLAQIKQPSQKQPLLLLLSRSIAFIQAVFNANILLLGELQLVDEGQEDAFTLHV